MDGMDLLLSDAVVPAGFVCLGAPKDHQAAIGLGELSVFLKGCFGRVASLRGRLLGSALWAKGATDVAPHSGVVFQDMPHLAAVERARGFERLLEVFRTHGAPMGLRYISAVSHGHHFLPTALLLPGHYIVAVLG
jgi:hypothetical protein